jgi:hypothetical protein
VKPLESIAESSRFEDAALYLWRVFNAQNFLHTIPDVARLATFYSPLHGENRFLNIVLPNIERVNKLLNIERVNKRKK